MIPTSYILQQELIHVGRIRYYGGPADVSDGQYLGRAVAIKHLKVIGDVWAGGAFKVHLIGIVHCPRSALSF
jgi:hypothetical protein